MGAVEAIAARSSSSPLSSMMIDRREVDAKDVLIDIRYCGICHTDVHMVRSEWGEAQYPLVPGHEITGVVKAVGDDVTRYEVGDRVGVGCMVESCRKCERCGAGQEQYCETGPVLTYGSVDRNGTITQGGYSAEIVVAEDFVLSIPDALALDAAAPLLCAGVTTYSPLRHWQVRPGSRVAVVGLGGLGHVAVQLAHAMGAEVTVLSRSVGKRDDALRLGADHFRSTGAAETFTELSGRFDLIVHTVSAPIDVDAHLGLLAVDGTLVNVGLPPEPMSLSVGGLIQQRRSYAGSLMGGLPETQEMLDFCAEHGVSAEIEVIEPDAVNEAFDGVVSAKVRYRYVIDLASLRPSVI